MDLKQLEYFIAIAEEENITAAAKRLNMAQPPLSQQLKNLEQDLQIRLFERTSRKIQLTRAGELFLQRARQITELSNSALQEMRSYDGACQGTALVGITPTAIPLVLSWPAEDFHTRYPKIKLEFFEGDTSYVLDILRKGIVDIGIVRSPFNIGEFCHLEKPDEPMVAAMASELNWSDRTECEVGELKDRELIIYRRYESLLLEIFAEYGFTPRIVCKGDRSSTALQGAEAGMGIAVLPASAIRMANRELVCKTITEPRLYTRTVAIWKPRIHLTKVTDLFLEYFEQL